MAMLEVRDLHAFYGKSHILQGVSLQINDGETVTLLGRNGAGKSTTLKAIAGVVAPQRGTVTFNDAKISGLPPHKIASRGVCFVPEHRGIFRLLTVEENLRLGARKERRALARTRGRCRRRQSLEGRCQFYR